MLTLWDHHYSEWPRFKQKLISKPPREDTSFYMP